MHHALLTFENTFEMFFLLRSFTPGGILPVGARDDDANHLHEVNRFMPTVASITILDTLAE